MTSLPKKSVTVRQVGTTLVAAFDTANPPLLWKFDLERNHSFALALQDQGGAWELGVTSGRNEFQPIARFRTHEDAEEAFLKTQDALLAKKTGGKNGGGNGWRLTAIGLMAVLALLVVVIVLPLMSMVHNLQGKQQAANAASSTPGAMKEGEPMDADQALKPPP